MVYLNLARCFAKNVSSGVRLSNLRLTLELVPSSSFYRNARQVLTKSRWSVISKQVRSRAYDICEICGVGGRLDCHEIWNYDDEKLVQKLTGLIALCKDCHSVKHFGLARIQNRGEQALKHFMKVNQMNEKQSMKYIANAFDVRLMRSGKTWKIDFTILGDYGIDVGQIKNEQ